MRDTIKTSWTASVVWALTFPESSQHSNTSASIEMTGKTTNWRRPTWAISQPVFWESHDIDTIIIFWVSSFPVALFMGPIPFFFFFFFPFAFSCFIHCLAIRPLFSLSCYNVGTSPRDGGDSARCPENGKLAGVRSRSRVVILFGA